MLFPFVILIPLKSLFWNDRFVWFVAQGNRRPSSNSPESSLHHSLQQWYETRWVTGEKLVKSTGSDQSFAFCCCFELSTFISNFAWGSDEQMKIFKFWTETEYCAFGFLSGVFWENEGLGPACNQSTYHRLTSWDHLESFGVRCIASRYFGCDRSWCWWKSWSQSHPNGEANGAIATTRRNVSWLQSKVLIISGSKMIHGDTFTFTFLDSQPSSKASRWKVEKSCQVSKCGAE